MTILERLLVAFDVPDALVGDLMGGSAQPIARVAVATGRRRSRSRPLVCPRRWHPAGS